MRRGRRRPARASPFAILAPPCTRIKRYCSASLRASAPVARSVEASLFESQIAWLLFRAVGYFATGKAPAGKLGSASAHIVPYQSYPTADGDIMVGVLNDALYRRLVTAMGLEELGEHPDFATNAQRVKNRSALNARLEARFAERGTAEWERIISEAGVPCSRINTIEDALLDPQTAARNMIMKLDHPTRGTIKVPGIPIKLSETPGSGRRPPPLLGQHQEQVLDEVGLPRETTAALCEQKRGR